MFENRAFGLALRNNLLIIVVSLLVQLPLALALALILAEKFRGAVALRMLFFLPYVLAEIATGLIFSFVYDGDYGLLAAIYRWFGAEAPHLLASPQTSMLAILIVIVWKYFGFHMMLYIAALQGIDRNLIEAARIDGARALAGAALHRHPAALSDHPAVGVLRGRRLAPAVRSVMPLTRGGPADSSHTMVSFLYSFGVTRMRVGFGSAVGVILFCHLRDLRLHLQTLVHAR